jgi:hypothetical protein
MEALLATDCFISKPKKLRLERLVFMFRACNLWQWGKSQSQYLATCSDARNSSFLTC